VCLVTVFVYFVTESLKTQAWRCLCQIIHIISHTKLAKQQYRQPVVINGLLESSEGVPQFLKNHKNILYRPITWGSRAVVQVQMKQRCGRCVRVWAQFMWAWTYWRVLGLCKCSGLHQVHHQTVNTGTVASTVDACTYEGWNFNSGNYLFTTDTK